MQKRAMVIVTELCIYMRMNVFIRVGSRHQRNF